jgi:hypothetical protein
MLSPAAAAKGRRRGPTVLESIREAEKRAQEAALAKEKEAQRRARVRTDSETYSNNLNAGVS